MSCRDIRGMFPSLTLAGYLYVRGLLRCFPKPRSFSITCMDAIFAVSLAFLKRVLDVWRNVTICICWLQQLVHFTMPLTNRCKSLHNRMHKVHSTVSAVDSLCAWLHHQRPHAAALLLLCLFPLPWSSWSDVLQQAWSQSCTETSIHTKSASREIHLPFI